MHLHVFITRLTLIPISLPVIPSSSSLSNLLNGSQHHKRGSSRKPNPIKNILFHWSLNTSSDAVDFPSAKFKSTGLSSRLSYSPKTAMDYGTVTCSASNELGPSETPCIYHIRPAGN
ncbi:Nephrin [Caligus rogercresseyi]|uniref:Nephrin n=1 Tax=Caligus rogercresseyi TaxID=217165 RepID=A0A7T8KKQ7_CALRO|nr:Nephrin [Caligus rogercresseyi]